MTETADVTELARLNRLDEEGRSLLFDGAQTAYAFADTPVSDDELRGIWDLAKWPPTSANFQPLRVLYVQSPDGRAKLVEQMNENNKAKTLSAGAVAVLAMDTGFHRHLPTVLPFRPELQGYFEENEQARRDAARNNSWLQAGYFLLAVRAQGLAAGPMGGFNGPAIDSEFFPTGDWSTIMVVNIGHPVEGSYRPRLPRLKHEDAIRWA